MTRMHDYWNEKTGKMESRPCTADELAALDAQKPPAAAINAPILAALASIDAKTARAIREAVQTGDNTRVLSLEAEAATLRAQLVKG